MHKFSKVVFLGVLLLTVSIANSEAQSSGGNKDSTMERSLDELAWLVGHWRGNAFGGVCDEIWSPASDGSMTGTFKLSVSGKVQFYELMVLTIDGGGPTLRLKHFNADMTGWEEKDKVITFAFQKMGDNEVQFEGMTYRSPSADSLEIEISTKDADGEVSKQLIVCQRVGE